MSTRGWSRAVLLIITIGSSGCAGDKALLLGQQAERLGQVHVAFDRYCDVALRYPGNTVAREAIRRLGPTAAVYWYAEARVACCEGRPDEAWRTAMRCLEIRPNHAEALAFVHRLEEDHPGEVAWVRGQWQSRGEVTLATPVLERTASLPEYIDSVIYEPPVSSHEVPALALATAPDSSVEHDPAALVTIAHADDPEANVEPAPAPAPDTPSIEARDPTAAESPETSEKEPTPTWTIAHFVLLGMAGLASGGIVCCLRMTRPGVRAAVRRPRADRP